METLVPLRDQNQARPGNVHDVGGAGNTKHLAKISARGHGVDESVRADLGPREPDFGSVALPRESAGGGEVLRQRPRAAVPIDHLHVPHVVAAQGMVEKRDVRAIRRNPRMADPPVRLEENAADRVLEAHDPTDLAADR